MKYNSNSLKTSFILIILCAIIVFIVIYSSKKPDKVIEKKVIKKQEIETVKIEHSDYAQQNETIDIPVIN